MPHKFSKDWFSSHVINWRTYLKEYRDKKMQYLEIGCFEGKSTVFILENYPHSHATVIDTFGQTFEYKLLGVCDGDYYTTFKENTAEYKDRVSINVGYSFDVLTQMLNEKFKTFDVIYVDASHTARGTLQDMVLSWELLRADGIMIIDDYNWDTNVGTIMHPKDGVDAFLLAYKGFYELLLKDYQVILRKVS